MVVGLTILITSLMALGESFRILPLTTRTTSQRMCRSMFMLNGLSSEESALLETIRTDPSTKKVVLEACRPLLSQPPQDIESLTGDWCVRWTDLGKGGFQKLLFKIFTPSLKMLSFGALPPIKVNLTDSYNRVTTTTYDLLQCFDLPTATGSGGTVGVAMALRGSGAVSKERPNRLEVQFETVLLLPAADTDPGDFCTALEAAGLPLEGAREPIKIEVKPTYIDVEHLSDGLRVHKGASGTTYVLERVERIPYTLE
eukprot:CAMPEP_0183332382 /NCGR_PEP_ID=MMETSP0164_2-20130417/1570_1 /TAXON_ID=221442 /ORGANISM="Coccolithus pelagicus ssp braarudi, Strain PLY182g" /LENGTH=255 /DNA_ID=CAMNT_0025501089 /DNA_START=26 /DNA_END=793 /DNA_ORIENTATION=+